MKILVTSGNGYVGRELFRQLYDQHEYPILAADNARIQSIFGWRARHTIVDALSDLWRDPDLIECLMAEYR
jgi:nucleoside-diphosphate-sugar epimerase